MRVRLLCSSRNKIVNCFSVNCHNANIYKYLTALTYNKCIANIRINQPTHT